MLLSCHTLSCIHTDCPAALDEHLFCHIPYLCCHVPNDANSTSALCTHTHMVALSHLQLEVILRRASCISAFRCLSLQGNFGFGRASEINTSVSRPRVLYAVCLCLESVPVPGSPYPVIACHLSCILYCTVSHLCVIKV